MQYSYFNPYEVTPGDAHALSFADNRLRALQQLIICCLHQGMGFDEFFKDYISVSGKRVYWNPFWRYGEGYSPAELYMILRLQGYGQVPEAAVNVFWQVQEQEMQPLLLE